MQAVIFDLDGVLADTAELHYQSWQELAAELKIPFDRRANDEMRGLSRPESLAVFLRGREAEYSNRQRSQLLDRKNEAYLRGVAELTRTDALPGAESLLSGLRARGARVAVASSSRNARLVIERLGLDPLLDAIVDGNAVPDSKPDPRVFLEAAKQVGAVPQDCVVIEDAEAGVQAARAAGMRVIGIGPVDRLGEADLVVAALRELTAETVLDLLARRG